MVVRPGSNATRPKRGIACAWNDAAAPEKVRAVRAAWYYNWGGAPSPGVAGAQFVPMEWGGKSAAFGGDHLLGFNEPDMPSQSDMTVDEALRRWPTLAASRGRLLGSPACARSHGWLPEFMRRSSELGLRVHFVAVHWYGGTDPDRFVRDVRAYHAAYRKPLWITEFACAVWKPGAVYEFMRRVLPALDRMEFVHRYCWKARTVDDVHMGTSSLFGRDGKLTRLGALYRGL